MVSDNIKKIRKEHYLSQIEFAKKIGVTQGAVSQWENGITKPNSEQVVAIAQAMHVSIDDILTAQNNPLEDKSREELLDALHQNPRLGMLFDRSQKMSDSDVDFMIHLADKILGERDGN